MSLGSANAAGGSGNGGAGRIAVYYHDTYTLGFTPGYLQHVNPNATLTPTLTATPTGATPTATATKTATSTPTTIPTSWQSRTYTYSETIPHAVVAVSSELIANSYEYDANGNMTCRIEDGITYLQEYNTENRISSISKLASGDCTTPGAYLRKWDFVYDGDGVRISTLVTPYVSGQPQTPTITAYYFGGAYEVTGSDVKKYYSFAGQTILRDSTGLQYLLTDHLGSVVAVTDDAGTLTSQQRYLPFGGVRTNLGSITQTDLGYTGQRQLDMGLMDYKARFFSSALGRFIQPDTLIPDPTKPQVFNRYSYVANNPVNFNDPTGHMLVNDGDGGCYPCTKLSPPIPDPEDEDDSEEEDSIFSSLSDSYMLGWTNFGTAWSIRTNPDVGFWQKQLADAYIGVWGGAHVMFMIGAAGLTCAAFGACLTTVEGLLGIGAAGNVACGGDMCASEAERGIAVLGRWPFNRDVAKDIGGNYLNIPTKTWESLNEAGRWALNQKWLDVAIARGDRFILASKWAERGTSYYFQELQYLFSKGYSISTYQNYLIPPP